MRRSSKSAKSPAAKAPASKGGFGRKSSKGPNMKTINAMFIKYAALGESPGEAIDMSGICQLGEDIGIDAATDVSILVLCWKLGAKAKPGHVMGPEWLEGMEMLGADSADKLKEQLPSFDLGFMEGNEFREFYKFSFQFSREGTHRTIERDVAAPLLEMVMGARSRYTDAFVEFLKQCPASTRVTFDQWSSFLEFSNTVKEGFEGYDEDGAWPILLDEFVEYTKGKSGSEGGAASASGQKSRP
ncbi:unnamed protein product [Ectocarpus fasciculatus]